METGTHLALTALLAVTCMTTSQGFTQTACNLPACFCANSTGSHSATSLPPAFLLTCFIKSLSQSDPTVQKLTSDVTSVKLICSDPSTGNYLRSLTFDHLPDLQHLGLENCYFSAVEPGALQAVPSLQVLEIQHCVFVELPSDVFSTAVNLSRLILTQSGLRSFPQLCSLQSLELLNVSGLSLSSLDESVEGCTSSETEFRKLAVLDVSNNTLTALPHALLSKATNLRELHVQDNRIRDISFRVCTKLEVLDCLGQELERANFTGDDCVHNLEVLKLQGNGSALFPVLDLRRMSNLTVLHLENTAVNDSFWEVLPSLKNLTNLALPLNSLTSINLTGDGSLLYVNLSGNAISGSMDSSTISSHRNLTVIDLSWNRLTKLTGGAFANLTSLRTLNLQHNRLVMVLHKAFQNLPDLLFLHLDNNSLASLPIYLLREMPALKVLSVDDNRLNSMPYLKDHDQLVWVSARRNRLRSLPMLSGVPRLEYLVLQGNRLSMVRSGVFLGAPLLSYLDLSNNSIVHIDRFQNHLGLRLIRLDHNHIQDVSFVFSQMPQLNSLFLDTNMLTRLTSEMFPPSLRSLSVSDNLLSYIEPGLFLSMHSLMIVNLGANGHLYSLPLSSVQISPTTLPKPAFTVAPNTFDCDCGLGYLKAWALTSASGQPLPALAAHLPVFHNLHVLSCMTHFTGQDQVLFEDVPLSDFVCPLQGAVCDDTCPCCQPQPQSHSLQPDANCTCLLTCPAPCSCFHGGSRYVQLYTHVFCERRNLTELPGLIPSRATHVHLDGNCFPVLNNTALSHLSDVIFLYLNGSGIEELEQGCFLRLDALRVLDLSDNNISRIDGGIFGGGGGGGGGVLLPSLEELDLQRNAIQSVQEASFSGLGALKVLRLNDNLLQRVDSFTTTFPPTAVLALAGNPWTCDCQFVAEFLKYLRGMKDRILDYSSLRCFWEEDAEDAVPTPSTNGTLLLVHSNLSASSSGEGEGGEAGSYSSVVMSEFEYSLYCSNRSVIVSPLPSHPGHVSQVTTVSLVCVAVVVVVAVAVGVTCVHWRRELQAVVYVKLGLRLWDDAKRRDRQEAEAVKSPRQYRLCVHYRDFPVGDCIADTIQDSVENSQRTILLLSTHFLDSDWCRFEFRTAHQHVLREGGHRLVLVLMEDVADDQLDADLRMAMKTRTYLTLKDPWFWEKLYFAMPDLPCRPPQRPRLPPNPHPGRHPTEVEMEEGAVAAQLTTSDSRADQMLEALDLTISREELSSVRSLVPADQSDQESDDNDFTVDRPAAVDLRTDTTYNRGHRDSHFHDDGQQGDDIVLITDRITTDTAAGTGTAGGVSSLGSVDSEREPETVSEQYVAVDMIGDGSQVKVCAVLEQTKHGQETDRLGSEGGCGDQRAPVFQSSKASTDG
ncbi:uncharacterized protein LOC143283071 isoform X2 [Babylonia areolata]|uniref:uncharacterized protein LOC143283071 isoform X2 n=1 Tax=Babylonia areolata TaxID=304850 RepID=UPI003FD465CD